MPIYEFECKRCHQVFEELCSFEDTQTLTCPACSSKRLQRVLAGNAVTAMFKDPRGTSKADNFDYMAHHNYQKAQQESRAARQAAGKYANPYKPVDFGNRMNFID